MHLFLGRVFKASGARPGHANEKPRHFITLCTTSLKRERERESMATDHSTASFRISPCNNNNASSGNSQDLEATVFRQNKPSIISRNSLSSHGKSDFRGKVSMAAVSPCLMNGQTGPILRRAHTFRCRSLYPVAATKIQSIGTKSSIWKNMQSSAVHSRHVSCTRLNRMNALLPSLFVLEDLRVRGENWMD